MNGTRNHNLKASLPHIQAGLLALVLALIASGMMIVLSQNRLAGAQQFHGGATKRLNEARKNLATAQEDRLNMATYAEEYALLLKRNVIGDEQRLDWIDGLEALRKQGMVLEYKYAIAPQQPYKPPVAVDSGNFALNASGMTLSFDLLHEGQLARFFNALRSNIRGQFLLDGCSMDRLDSETSAPSPSGVAPLLKAECKGEWLTLKNRSAP